MYFDTHSHVFDEAMLDDLEASGVSEIIIVGYDPLTSKKACDLAVNNHRRCMRILPAVGIHPLCVSDDFEGDISTLRSLIRDYPVTAVGEFGLDYYDEKVRGAASDRDRQRRYFKAQMELCGECSLPAIIHSRKAAQETYDTLAAYPNVKGVMHSFIYSAEMARRFCDLGWYIGIGTMVCSPEAKKLPAVVRDVPADMLLAETDREVNETRGGVRLLSVAEVAKRIAEVRGEKEDIMLPILRDNALRLFGQIRPV